MNSNNKKIVKNTIVVYINMLASIIVGLYTSRLVLSALGVSDLGLYNVVGGIVTLCMFILSSLSVTTTRFINCEMGKPDGDLNKVFNVCNTLHIVLAIVVLLISEIIGIWYIENFLNVDTGKMPDAMFVFQVSIIVSCMGVTNIPFASLFNAHENFLFSAIVNVGLLFLQFFLVVSLLYYDGNKIRAYALMMSLSTFITFVVYHYYCRKYWPQIIKWRFVKDKKLYRSALNFNNYNLLSTAAIMSRSQGAAMLINYFFNTSVNGAFAISRSVERFVLLLSVNYDKAAYPQIMQNYSSGNYERMTELACNVGRYTILIMIAIMLPLYSEMDFVLRLWLGQVPNGALEFCNATLFVAFVSVTGAGVATITDCDKIKYFKLTFSFLLLICIPLGYFMFKMGFEPYYLLLMFAIMDSIWRCIHLILAHIILKFDSLRYLKEAYFPGLLICSIIVLTIYFSSLIQLPNDYWHFLRLLFIFSMSVLLAFKIGLTSSENYLLMNFVKRKWHSLYNWIISKENQ